MSSTTSRSRNRTATSYDASAIEVLEGLEPVRKRPGMYIGGTDERALHHLVAEILDNSMDEAVAGHANVINVTLVDEQTITIADNGRGIPVDPHPRFPDKSALEVVMCTLHAGGKFSGNTYRTSGGLHGVGVSVVNALSRQLRVEVIRNRQLYVQEFSKGEPLGKIAGPVPMRASGRGGTSITFSPDPEIFGAKAKLKPAQILHLARSKAYLFSGVKIRWRCEFEAGDNIPRNAEFHFPGGLSEYLEEKMNGTVPLAEKHFAGKIEFAQRFGNGAAGSVEWAVNWSPSGDGFIRSYCNTIHTVDGGTHEAGFWSAILKGFRAYGEYTSNKRVKQVVREDLQSSGCVLVSCFISDPEFVGQTKNRLATVQAQRLVEGSVRDHFDNWLSGNPQAAGAVVERLVAHAEDRIRRKVAKETARKSATQKLRLPGKLVDCTRTSAKNTELFIVEGDSAGGSAKMARDREIQALLPIRGKILNVLAASPAKVRQNAEIRNLCLALGVGLGPEFDVDKVRYEKIIIMTDADVDGAHIASLLMTFFFSQMRPLVEHRRLYLACPPLYRITQGQSRVYALDDEEKEEILANGMSAKGKVEVSRFKGLGEMDAKDLKRTTMDPSSRSLLRITVEESERVDTESLLTQLMGRRPEARFKFITDNAEFADNLDV